ncbi:FecR family protein [Mangrovibacterium marinum]|uniref:FecR family protein n=1 Tax=Mangrovibacterium marinum TaxID=1639118 RepID=A0A2T5BZ58_9BACT|nr:FecR family protein [Mangrovibacterium marinum]PTN07546.1 FecR family protein [Mangrovibacterium marinum]
MAVNRKHIDNVFGQKQSLRDQQMLERYFEDIDLNEETRQIVKEQWEQFDATADGAANIDHVFHKLFYTITNSTRNSGKIINLRFRIAQIAAILIVGIFLAGAIYFTRSSYHIAESQQIEFISTSGFRNQFKLPDGTTGWLGADSELKYQLEENNHRVVKLDGLAFFNVVHNDSPFIVKTPKNLNVEVMGTRFNVSAYSADPSCEVVLEEGSVLLSNTSGLNEKMVPNDRIVFDLRNNQLKKSQVNTSDYLSWIDGKLVLKDISLREACLRLSRFYNVDMEVRAENIDKEKVRLVLENESLEDALKLLSVIAPISYQVEERKARGDDSYSRKKIIILNKSPM